jgi:hypothetical protein
MDLGSDENSNYIISTQRPFGHEQYQDVFMLEGCASPKKHWLG